MFVYLSAVISVTALVVTVGGLIAQTARAKRAERPEPPESLAAFLETQRQGGARRSTEP